MESRRCSVAVGFSAGQTLPFGHADVRQDSALGYTHEIEVRHLQLVQSAQMDERLYRIKIEEGEEQRVAGSTQPHLP